MSEFAELPDPLNSPRPPVRHERNGRGVLPLILVGCASLLVLPCAGLVGWLVYVSDSIPEASVYPGNRVPKRFIATMQEVGALEEGEKLLYFYSDAMTDIRDSFCFVSNKRVVTYRENWANRT